jgi:hypothetical protein
MSYSQTELFPVVIEPIAVAITDIAITSQKINKDMQLIATIEANTNTKNLPLITKEVVAKGFLRAAVEYMGNDVSAVLDELKIIYARMQAIAEANRISDEKGHPMEASQFNSLVDQNLWMINHIMSGKGELDRLRHEYELNKLHDECDSFPEEASDYEEAAEEKQEDIAA